jgi:CubicO group peptidase (beta-lactamase class C family)
VRHLLSHSAGLHPLRDVISGAYEMLDWDLVCTQLARQTPRYEPGTRHGYHGITYGFLVGEVIRRVTGTPVHDAVETEIVKPLGLDGMSIGAPPDRRDRVAQLLVNFGDADRAERFARRAARLAWMRPAIDTFVVPESDPAVRRRQVLDSPIPSQRLPHRARSRMYAALAGGGVPRRRTVPVDGDAAARPRSGLKGHRHRRRLPDALAARYHLARRRRASSRNGFAISDTAGPGCVGRPDNDLAVDSSATAGRHAVRRPALPARRRAGATAACQS